MNQTSIGNGTGGAASDEKTARLEELRTRTEARLAARKQKNADLELERLELLDRFEDGPDAIGPHGVDFSIIDCREHDEGFIVVKRGAPVCHTKFQKSKQTEGDVALYVRPNVIHPAKELYDQIVARRPQIAIRVGSALAGLYGGKGDEEAGK